MPADRSPVVLRQVAVEAPTARRGDAEALPGRAAAPAGPRVSRRQLTRWSLFALLPLALLLGSYWYVTGGRLMTTDNAYVEADKVGLSTDVSGIVKTVAVSENQQVTAGQVLYQLDDLPFRLALQRAEAQVGNVRNDLMALKASYGDMQAQIKQAQDDAGYYDREYHRQEDLASKSIASQQT